ncbi:MAG: fumarylacetoacetate hydrolase family protein [Candidatus Bathyarchaeota archaeon]|nr:fumarylacetoacetate hydrolase family protein [Candidatus Bathyarchaeota archaeon]
MKLVRFFDSGTTSYGVLDDDYVICLPIIAKKLGEPFPSNLEAFISQGKNEEDLKFLIESTTKHDLESATYSLANLRLLAPIICPPKIVCLGLNYKDHVAEQGKDPPNEPVFFLKPRTAIVGPNDNVVKPKFVEQLDYEAELAVVIGKRAKNISAVDAESFIFGYTILNDVSARDIQFKDKQWTRGKSLDTFAPIGPCITVSNQIKEPFNLQVRTWINKELRQNSNTRNMLFNVLEIVQYLSNFMTLEPCDLISTGTPAGVGFAIKPLPKFLEDGDTIEIEIEDIGILTNRVVSL